MNTVKLDKKTKIFIISAVAITLAVIAVSAVILSAVMSETYNTDWMEGKPLWLIEFRYGGFDFENDQLCGYFVRVHRDLFGDVTGETKVLIYYNEKGICTGAQQITSS